MVARSQSRHCRAGWSCRAGRGYGEKVSAPPRQNDIFVVNESDSNLLNFLRTQEGLMASEYPFVVEILTPTQMIFRARLGWGEFVPGEVQL